MVSSGTLADRAAALTTLVQQDSIHNIYNLQNMVNMVQKKDRRESMAAIGMVLFSSEIFCIGLPVFIQCIVYRYCTWLYMINKEKVLSCISSCNIFNLHKATVFFKNIMVVVKIAKTDGAK